MIKARFRALTAHSKQIRTEALEAQVKAIQLAHLKRAQKILQDYPPPIPTSSYERTFNLQKGWDIRGPNSTGGGITSILVNNVSYSGFVHGTDQGVGQARIHQGRWPLLKDAIDRSGYISDLRSMVRGLIV